MAYAGLSQHIDFDRLPTPEGRFTLNHLIGEGTYGEVYSAKDNKSGASVAIKVSVLRLIFDLDRQEVKGSVGWVVIVRVSMKADSENPFLSVSLQENGLKNDPRET